MPAGEDDEAEAGGCTGGAKALQGAGAAADQHAWYIESQRAWDFRGELCTLTCEQVSDGSHMRFELLKKNNDLLTVTCTREQFQELWDECGQLSGPSRTDATISRLFEEGLEEFPEGMLAAASHAGTCGGDEDKNLDDFGEDDAEPARPSLKKAKSVHMEVEPDEWYVESEHSWEFGGEHCTLITSTRGDEEVMRFQVFKMNRDTITITCTREQFQELCDEQKAESEPARANAAIRQLFKEGLEEFPENVPGPPPQASQTSKDLSRRLKAMLRGWSRCSSDAMVEVVDMKALLRRLHPNCPDKLLDMLMGTAVGGRVNVDTLVDMIIHG